MEYISYLIASVLAIVLGQITAHLCKKLPPWVEDKIKFKDFILSLKKDFEADYIYTVIYLILFNLLIKLVGQSGISYIYMLCIFSLTIVFNIDYRYQLIPDECHYIIALCGSISLIFNINTWMSCLLGAIVGGGSFYLLGLLAIVIYKKEGMGFGDVKLMAALGFLFGLKNILVITILSFTLGAIISIVLIILKVKKIDSYIPFGPFIVMGTLLVIFFKSDIFIDGYFTFCSWLGTSMTDIIFKIIN